jgi:hypothetical protein
MKAYATELLSHTRPHAKYLPSFINVSNNEFELVTLTLRAHRATHIAA